MPLKTTALLDESNRTWHYFSKGVEVALVFAGRNPQVSASSNQICQGAESKLLRSEPQVARLIPVVDVYRRLVELWLI